MEQRDDQDLSPNDAELEQQDPEEFDAVEPDEVAEVTDDGDDAIDVEPVDDFRLPAPRASRGESRWCLTRSTGWSFSPGTTLR